GRRPMDRRLFRKRRALACQLPGAPRQLRNRGIVQSRPDMTGVLELPVLPVAEKKRAQRLAGALPLRAPADDEFRSMDRFHLDPRRNTLTRLIDAVAALRHDPFVAACHRRRVQRLGILGGVNELDMSGWQEAL